MSLKKNKISIALFYEERSSWIKKNPGLSSASSIARTLVTQDEITSIKKELRKYFEISLVNLSEISTQELPSIFKGLNNHTVFWNLSDGQHRFKGSLIPALARLNDKYFIGSSTYSQGLACAKHHWKPLVRASNILTANWKILTKETLKKKNLFNHMNPPYFVKVADLGNNSGFLISRTGKEINPLANNDEEAIKCAQKILKMGISTVIVEEFLPGEEYSIAGINIKTWELKVIKKQYEIPYINIPLKDESSEYFYSEKFVKNEELLKISKMVIKLLNIKDYFRLDVRQANDGSYNLMDINTNPFLTSNTFKKFLTTSKRSFGEAIVKMVVHSIERQKTNL